MALIELFVVPPSEDEAFLADWRRERTGTLYRSLRDDVARRFVGVSPDGQYEIVHEDGAVDEPGGVILIEPFEVPRAQRETFLEAWQRRRAILAAQRGYLGTRLHSRVGPGDFEFIAIARWSSPLMVQRARRQPEMPAATVPFRSHPALYQRVETARP